MRKSEAKGPAKGREPAWTILRILEWTTSYFESRDIESPRTAAEILLAHALGLGRIDLYLRYDQPLSPDERATYKALIKRRAKREPAAYIVGAKEFWSMELEVTPDVLVPRPETECLVERALELLPEDPGENGPMNVLELGTGSGAVVLALAAERPAHRIFASDRSPAALGIARANAERHRLSGSVSFFAGDWFRPLKSGKGLFHMVVSNPPYVASGTIGELEPEVRDYEPRGALDGGERGLDSIGDIVRQCPSRLISGGHLLLEIGWDQGPAVMALGRDSADFAAVRVEKDYAGLDRVAVFRKRS